VRVLALAALALFVAAAGPAQGSSDQPGIQDNSFLIEESYNQAPGVVQHISLFRKDPRTGEWAASFTQEWPVGGERHQLSYSLTYLRVASDAGDFTGFGDLALNYRLQLVGGGEARVAMAPRLTIFLPSGSASKGLGTGGTGLQLGIPVSVVLSDRFVAHGNVGLTWTSAEKDTAGDEANVFSGYAGGSLVWLARSNFNVMLETLWSRGQIVVAPHRKSTDSSAFVSPGIRWSYDFPSGLQIVPGIAAPIGVGPSHGRYGILVYLSFEHPFSSAARR
jgi:Putative MetA-pathway of phenol degradation